MSAGSLIVAKRVSDQAEYEVERKCGGNPTLMQRRRTLSNRGERLVKLGLVPVYYLFTGVTGLPHCPTTRCNRRSWKPDKKRVVVGEREVGGVDMNRDRPVQGEGDVC